MRPFQFSDVRTETQSKILTTLAIISLGELWKFLRDPLDETIEADSDFNALHLVTCFDFFLDNLGLRRGILIYGSAFFAYRLKVRIRIELGREDSLSLTRSTVNDSPIRQSKDPTYAAFFEREFYICSP